MSEQFILFCGRSIKPWIYTEEPVNKLEAIQLVVTGECYPVKTIAFDVKAGTCRDVSREIAVEAMNLWAYSGEPLTYAQREFIEQSISIQAANSFAQAAE